MINLLNVGSIVDSVGRIADDLFTSDEERLKADLEGRKLSAGLIAKQMSVNTAEAQHKSVFVAGGRPFIMWVCGIAMSYQFILYPLLTWCWAFLQANGYVPEQLSPPPILDTDALWLVVTGMLGLGGMRSFDKVKNTQTDKIR